MPTTKSVPSKTLRPATLIQFVLLLSLVQIGTQYEPDNQATPEVTRVLKGVQMAYEKVSKQFSPIYDTQDRYYRSANRNSATKSSTRSSDYYDFIIVGAGSAGTVLANRLSQVPNWRILLLEVGYEPTVLSDIPMLAPLLQFTNLNWGYLMERQANVSLGMVDERMAWPHGRALGGSSIINYMIHVRGNRHDYDRWAAMGNPGWSYKDVLPLFVRSEDFRVRHQDRTPVGLHRLGGELSVNDVLFRSESARAFVSACQQSGYAYIDYNGNTQLGTSFVHATERAGLRCSGEKAFLRPAQTRPNLRIMTGSRVVKLLIDKSTNTVEGVQYVHRRRYQTAFARKEVILTAGALSSPQLLMLSGIGPRRQLEDLGIPVVMDLPVGQKLYDHVTFIGLVFTVNASITLAQQRLYEPASMFELLGRGIGPLTSLGGVEALSYLRTNYTDYTDADLQNEPTLSPTPPPDHPDMELIFVGGSMHTDNGQFYRRTFRVTDHVYNKVWKPLEGRTAWSVLPMLMHPRSYGRLELKSKNPYHWPRFYGNYFTDPGGLDIKRFIAAIREVQRIAQAPEMRRYDARLHDIPIPGCEHHTFDSDAYWECAVRHLSPTLHHQVATCKMGPAHDPEAVVDNKLRVYGMRNLRVADTSIIPIPLTAHTNVPAFMVGEKASDLLKEEWQPAIAPPIGDAHFDIDIRAAARSEMWRTFG